MIAAGITAMDALTMKLTILPKLMSKSLTTTAAPLAVMDDEIDSLIGQPQDGQDIAKSETLLEHSGHSIKAMALPFFLYAFALLVDYAANNKTVFLANLIGKSALVRIV